MSLLESGSGQFAGGERLHWPIPGGNSAFVQDGPLNPVGVIDGNPYEDLPIDAFLPTVDLVDAASARHMVGVILAHLDPQELVVAVDRFGLDPSRYFAADPEIIAMLQATGGIELRSDLEVLQRVRAVGHQLIESGLIER